jgi:hypothetical protein
MVKPISLRLRNAEILAKARATLGSAREARLKQSHDAAVNERARNIVERAKEEKRLRYGENAARRALLVIERPCRQCDGRSKRKYDLTSSIVPRGTSFHRWVDLRVFSYLM